MKTEKTEDQDTMEIEQEGSMNTPSSPDCMSVCHGVAQCRDVCHGVAQCRDLCHGVGECGDGPRVVSQFVSTSMFQWPRLTPSMHNIKTGGLELAYLGFSERSEDPVLSDDRQEHSDQTEMEVDQKLVQNSKDEKNDEEENSSVSCHDDLRDIDNSKHQMLENDENSSEKDFVQDRSGLITEFKSELLNNNDLESEEQESFGFENPRISLEDIPDNSNLDVTLESSANLDVSEDSSDSSYSSACMIEREYHFLIPFNVEFLFFIVHVDVRCYTISLL